MNVFYKVNVPPPQEKPDQEKPDEIPKPKEQPMQPPLPPENPQPTNTVSNA